MGWIRKNLRGLAIDNSKLFFSMDLVHSLNQWILLTSMKSIVKSLQPYLAHRCSLGMNKNRLVIKHDSSIDYLLQR